MLSVHIKVPFTGHLYAAHHTIWLPVNLTHQRWPTLLQNTNFNWLTKAGLENRRRSRETEPFIH